MAQDPRPGRSASRTTQKGEHATRGTFFQGLEGAEVLQECWPNRPLAGASAREAKNHLRKPSHKVQLQQQVSKMSSVKRSAPVLGSQRRVRARIKSSEELESVFSTKGKESLEENVDATSSSKSEDEKVQYPVPIRIEICS